MEFVPDVKKARIDIFKNFFSEYSPAYLGTNEDLRNSMQLVPANCNRALTVAASGDHPLFCSLYGAKHVDTFDISYNAKCLMDIKTEAVKNLNHDDYISLIKNLNQCYDVIKVPHMDKILNKLSVVESEYMCSMNGVQLFNHETWGQDNYYYLPAKREYDRLKTIVKTPYNFIMTDISSLSFYLTESYDFIHLSNIFDYILSPGHQAAILYGLFKHLNIKGKIIIEHMRCPSWTKPPFARVDMVYDVLQNIRFTKYGGNISIFERVR